MRTEKQLQQYIQRKIKDLGGLCQKTESRSARGWPDLTAVYNGQVVFIEVKSPAGTGRLSDLQARCLNNLTAQGATAFVIDTKESANGLIEDLRNGTFK